jgi:hypothetical protein
MNRVWGYVDQITGYHFALLMPDLHQSAAGQDVEEFVGVVLVRIEMRSGGDFEFRDVFEI